MFSFWTWLLGGALAAFLIYRRYPWLRYDFQLLAAMLPAVAKLLGWERKRILLVDIFEQQAEKNPDKTFLIYQRNNYSYRYMNNMANKVARVGQRLRLKASDCVAILIKNEPAFIWTYLGLAKIGVQMALLNFNLRSRSLLHCFNVSGANLLIVGQGDDLVSAVHDIYKEMEPKGLPVYVQGTSSFPEEFRSFDDLVSQASEAPVSPDHRLSVTHKDPLCFIYTSGTTGLPKAAIMSQMKALKGAVLIHSVGMREDDVLYTPLPLYHSAAGVIGLGNVITRGATLVLRDKFSATHFWEDCVENNVTVIQYIGELCRYLVSRPRGKFDREHKVRIAFGNGLRKDVWAQFVDRFGVPVIGEFYAATEGNSGFLNIWNKIGCIGRASPLMYPLTPSALIKYDFETAEPVRNEQGHCIKVKMGDHGLMISPIKRRLEFDGYRGKPELSSKKILHDVFRKGDRWYNSGDLMVMDDEYFIYFHDRIGDTFRWKGENCSTTELANVIADPDWIEDANVYGVEVPGQDGRAGMAAVCLMQDQHVTEERLAELYRHCADLLPSYAHPRFLRFQDKIDVTGTFKQKKVDLVKQGFNPELVHDKLYVMHQASSTFIPLTQEIYEKILKGNFRL